MRFTVMVKVLKNPIYSYILELSEYMEDALNQARTVCPSCGEPVVFANYYDMKHHYTPIDDGQLKNKNIQDDDTAIRLGLPFTDAGYVKCPEQDAMIDRHECLDYSGSHLECAGCETGTSTKRMLLPPKE
jgi:ribosomal protein S27AE